MHSNEFKITSTIGLIEAESARRLMGLTERLVESNADDELQKLWRSFCHQLWSRADRVIIRCVDCSTVNIHGMRIEHDVLR